MFNFTGVLLTMNSTGTSGYANPVKDWFEEYSIEISIIFWGGFIFGVVTVLTINYLIKLSKEDKDSVWNTPEEVKENKEEEEEEDNNETLDFKEYKNKRG